MKTDTLKKPSDPLELRQLPQAVEIEQSILSTCFLGGAEEISEFLQPEDFYIDKHRLIFTAIKDMVRKSVPVAIPSLVTYLRHRGIIDQCGGAGFISHLVDAIPAAGNSEHYCNLLRDASLRRNIITLANNFARQAYEYGDPQAIIDEAQSALNRLGMGSQKNSLVSYGELAYRMPEKWESLSTKNGITGIPSGFESVDKVTGGFQASDLVVLAARPGMGKTALAISLAQGAAENGIPVLFYSLEMSAEQLYNRQTSRVARVDGQKFRTGDIQSGEWARIVKAQEHLYELHVHIDDTPRAHIRDIVRGCRRAVREHGIRMIILDYLQLIQTESRLQRKDLEIAYITGALKAVAKELNLPVILLSQLNRNLENRDDKRPRLSDLRDSGAIEQDSDLILFVYRDEYYHPETNRKGVAELDFAKHRNGKTGVIELEWIAWRASFEDIK